MSRIQSFVAICCAVFLVAGGGARAADLALGLDGGLSMVAGRTYGEFFDAGYAIGGSIFYSVHENISLGGHLRHHSWKANARPYDWTRADGSASLLEIVPAVRFTAQPERLAQKVRLFAELGAGYASVDSDAVSWTVPDLPEDPLGPEEPIITADGDILLNFGLGISIESEIGFQIELLPTLHYLLADEALPFVSFDLGLSIGI
jgi:hypothetical protein